MSLMLKEDRKLLNLPMLVFFLSGEISRCCFATVVRDSVLLAKQKRKEMRYMSKLHLQYSQMSQSCKIRLGDSSEVVCIQIPGQRNGTEERTVSIEGMIMKQGQRS